MPRFFRRAALGLLMAALLGCAEPTGTPTSTVSPAPAATGSGASGQFALAWKHDLPARAQGVGVVPSGEVYLAVDASLESSDAFAEGGGAMVFSARGAKLEEIPTILPLAFEGAIRQRFVPNTPRVASGSLYLANYGWGLFRIDPTTYAATQIPVNLNGLSTSLTGLDASSACSADGSRAYLTGTQLYELHLASGKLERAVDFGRPIKQITEAATSTYLLNLTENLDSAGTLALWNPVTEASLSFQVPYAVRGMAVRGDWAVGVVETGLTEYRVVEWDLAQRPPVERALGSFRMTGGNELRMAIRPGKRQVAIGTAGISGVNEGSITLLTGSTVFIDAAKGTIGRADTSSVQGLDFSPDGGMLYVADTGGLKAFALP